MSARRLLKFVAFAAGLAVVLPFVVASWLEKRLGKGEGVFTTFGQLISIVPGPPGIFLRAAYYFGTLESCSWETSFGFGSLFTHRGAVVARNVSSGAFGVYGHASLGEGVRIASRVSIPSGKRQHLDENGRLFEGAHFDRVSIGAGAWIGEGAIVMADVGKGSIVSAGAVVLGAMPEHCIVGGNPARVIKELAVSGQLPDSHKD